MLYLTHCTRFAAGVALLGGVLLASGVPAATLLVGPLPAAYQSLEAAVVAAKSGDVIILDEVSSPYVLTKSLVVTKGKSPLRIQGQFSNNEVPEEIVIEGLAGGPAIIVEEDAELVLRHLTVTGGTTGIQALKNSRAILDRVYVSETGAEGMSVTQAEQVDIISSIFNACGAEGIIVNSGKVDIAQSTFIDNTDVAIDLQGGTCKAGATYFYNNNGSAAADQLTAAVAGLTIDYCGVVQGNVPAPVVETNDVEATAGFTPVMAAAFADPDNLLFDPASTWRGKVLLSVPTGVAGSAIDTDAPFSRDFLYNSRAISNAQVGAHEFGAVVAGVTWVNCLVTQYNNPTPGLVGLGQVDIELQVAEGSLIDAKLYLVPEAPRGNVTNINMCIPIDVESSTQNENYGVASLTISDSFMTTPGGAELLLDGKAELFLQMPGDPLNVFPTPSVLDTEFGTGYNVASIEAEAEEGRFFTIDTLPPVITDFTTKRADDYVVYHTDSPTDAIGGSVLTVPWSASADAPLASSVGVLDGGSGSQEPHLFFNENLAGTLDFTIEMTFTDSNVLVAGGTSYPISSNGGFLPAPAPQSTATTPLPDLLSNPADLGLPTAGMAWWEQLKGLPYINGTTGLTVSYSGGGKSGVAPNLVSEPLVVTWAFTDVPTSGAYQFWEAVAQFGAEDLVGNESGAASSSNPYRYPINPFHLWQLYDVAGSMRGPGGDDTSAPIVTWDVERFQGVSPRNTNNAFPICQYAVYHHPTVTNFSPTLTGWDVAGPVEWSDWIATRRIDSYTLFRDSDKTLLGDIIQAPGLYMIVVRTADEAGNVVDISGYPGLVGLNMAGLPPFLTADTWVNEGLGISLDTRVTPIFWHNQFPYTRRPEQGEKTFGASTRIPLPPADTCTRVEAGFTITMDLPDSASTGAAGVYFELYEDGQIVATGTIAGMANSSDLELVIPGDLLFPAASPYTILGLSHPNPAVGYLDFLNYAHRGLVPIYDCEGDGVEDQDRLGDEGDPNPESGFRQRNVTYQLVVATQLMSGEIDPTPATVEFTVTVDRALKDDQPVKTFTKE